MKERFLAVNRIFAALPDQLRRNRRAVWFFFFLTLALCLTGLGRMQMNMAMDSFFPEEEPVKKAYDRFRQLFGSDEMLFLVYEAKDGDILSEASLKALAALEEELLQQSFNQDPQSPLRRIQDVTSLISANYMEVKGDQLLTREFIGTNLPRTEQEQKKLRAQAMAHPSYPLLYLSEDKRFGGILIETDFNAEPLEPVMDEFSLEVAPEREIRFKKTQLYDYAAFMAALEGVTAKYDDRLEFHPVGNPKMMATAFKAMTEEGGLMMTAAFGLILVLLWVLFRSFAGVLWPLSIVILSILMTLGLAGWSGMEQSNMMQIMVFLLLAVGIADAIHILSGYQFFRSEGLEHEDALNQVYARSGMACFLTSLTTAVGLVSLLFVPIQPVRVFGLFAAVGVMIAFLLTILLLPLFLDLYAPHSKKSKQGKKHHLLQDVLRSIELFSMNHPKAVTALFVGVSLVMGWGATKLKVDTDNVGSMKESSPLRLSYELVDRYMGGVGNMEILIEADRIDALKRVEVLQAMEELQGVLEEKIDGKLVKTMSIVDLIKESHKALHEGKEEMYFLPDDQKRLSQTLFLLELGSAEQRRKIVTDDYRHARIGLTTKNLGSAEGVILYERINAEIARVFGPLQERDPGLKIEITGQLPMLITLSDFISWSQLKSFGFALLVITLLLPLVLASLRVGLIGVLPNLMPMVTIFGLMGLLGVPLEMHLLLVAPITIGIAVDDTIHFLTHYQLETGHGSGHEEALVKSIREVGQAILFTSLVLSLGFLCFLYSSNAGFVNFGIFSAIAIFTALLADLFFLPALLTLTRGKSARPE